MVNVSALLAFSCVAAPLLRVSGAVDDEFTSIGSSPFSEFEPSGAPMVHDELYEDDASLSHEDSENGPAYVPPGIHPQAAEVKAAIAEAADEEPEAAGSAVIPSPTAGFLAAQPHLEIEADAKKDAPEKSQETPAEQTEEPRLGFFSRIKNAVTSGVQAIKNRFSSKSKPPTGEAKNGDQ